MFVIRFLPFLLLLTFSIIVERPITQISWCGASIIYTREDETIPQFQGLEEEKTIFFITEAHLIYQSNGTVWNQIEGLFEDIQVSPADSRVIYLFGQQGQKSYRTNDCGENFEEINIDGFYGFRLNKMSWKWMLAFKKQQCDHFDMDCREPYNNQLFYSEDGAKTWLPSFKNCREASWDKVIEDIAVPDERSIVLFSYENQTQLIYSDDFTNYHTLMVGAQGYYQTQKYLFVLTSSNNGGYELHYGHSKLEEFQEKLVELPLQILKEFSYTVLDTENGRIYLSVSHYQQEQSITNVYISNQLGKDFQIVLTNNVRSTSDGNCDFEKLLGLTQTYVANTYDQRDQKAKSTVISFNGGKKWESIKAPKFDSEGNIVECGGECSLHFVGRTESYRQTIYTVDQAPGIVLGVGNVGLFITQEQNTYMSADGGQNWIEVRKGSHVFEIADFGGIIVMAKDFEPTNEIIYSIDYGKTWKTKIIYDDLFIAQNLVTEASGTVRQFLIYGKTDKGEGIILRLDFSDIFQRDCKSNLDYDIWNSKCIDGSQTKYYRKKENSECFNPKQMITKKIIEPCPCKREDWICASGYASQLEGGDCLPIVNISDYCEPGTTYFKSQGYIKLTQCVGGLDLDSIETYCPKNFNFNEILLYLTIIALLVFLIFFAYAIIRRMLASGDKSKDPNVNIYNQMEFQEDDDEEDQQL
ncbi:unnamed protein product [Paramecium sonneborni]|uniref:VPS10 domain-containing protein n=1 Tax=Paramecium sonneborni TaxID=65129 RepID=A0A8S1QK59_9CILI|nr:unnamed protein product [Paramecium sonneborni]